MILLFAIILLLNYFGFPFYLLKNCNSFFSISIIDLFYRNIFMFSGFFLGAKGIYNNNSYVKIKIVVFSLISIFIIKTSFNKKKFDYISVQLIVIIIFIFSSFFPFEQINS